MCAPGCGWLGGRPGGCWETVPPQPRLLGADTRSCRSLWLTGRSEVAPPGTRLSSKARTSPTCMPSGLLGQGWLPGAVAVLAVCCHGDSCLQWTQPHSQSPRVSVPRKASAGAAGGTARLPRAGPPARPTPGPGEGGAPSLPSTPRIRPFEVPTGEASLNRKQAFIRLASPTGSFS